MDKTRKTVVREYALTTKAHQGWLTATRQTHATSMSVIEADARRLAGELGKRREATMLVLGSEVAKILQDAHGVEIPDGVNVEAREASIVAHWPVELLPAEPNPGQCATPAEPLKVLEGGKDEAERAARKKAAIADAVENALEVAGDRALVEAALRESAGVTT